MKKLIASIALLVVTGGAFAQKSNVNRAYNKVKSESPNYGEAKGLIDPALTNEESKNWSKTWYTAGLIQYGLFDAEWTKKGMGQNFNPDVLYNSLMQCYEYFLKTDEVDNTPDEKGKVKPKYTKEVKDYLAFCRNFFIDAGNYYLSDKSDFVQAEKFFEKYVQYPDLKIVKDDNVAKDSLFYSVTVYAGYAAYQAKLDDKAIAYMESVLGKPMLLSDEQLAYEILRDEYSERKPNADKLIALAKEGIKKFEAPANLAFYQILINQSVKDEKTDEAIAFLNEAIAVDENIAPLWELKGQLLESKGDVDGAIENYKKAIEIDPALTTAYMNIGRVYYNQAAKIQEKAQDLEGEEYNKGMEAANPFFEKAMPNFEKVRELDPDNQDNLKALRLIYYNLNQGAKYEELNKLLGEE